MRPRDVAFPTSTHVKYTRSGCRWTARCFDFFGDLIHTVSERTKDEAYAKATAFCQAYRKKMREARERMKATKNWRDKHHEQLRRLAMRLMAFA